jgi:hypothetical protein
MQTLHRLRTDQLQLTSSGCHFVADNFRLASRFFDLPTSNHTPYNQPPKTSTATTTAIAVAPAAQHSRRPAAQHEPSNTCTNEICRLWTWTHNRLTTSPTDNDTTERQHRTITPHTRTLTTRLVTKHCPDAARTDALRGPPTATPNTELRHPTSNFDTRYRTSTPGTGLRHPKLDLTYPILDFDTPSWHNSGDERSSYPECA